ncbi:hypothetical protein ILFOPFJJ_06821 [Ensifer psoraleae]|uniref:hypothetical protein n=1 Tax=Sinorhizobium psoraleae TaxID=520838 RepID=UPI00156810F4|nr:hypothetical protein [Sinorhizobium psoraleae]NRP75897.1 hypothetical protein [Sinorhizobium psoraleae]
MIRVIFTGAVIVLAASATHAADLVVDYVAGARQCDTLDASSLAAGQDITLLTKEVVSRMDQAVAVADDPRWISSTRPTFVWASEAKVACGKAYGYLQSGWRDEDYLAKCDCFHAKMLRFMH